MPRFGSKTRFGWLLAAAMSLVACTDERGLILNGSVDIVEIPDGKAIWLGLWINDPDMRGAPDAFTPLSDALQQSQGLDQAMYAFGWRTFVLPSQGATLYVGGYLEDATYGDGVPNAGVIVHPAQQNPLQFVSENLTSEGNGAYEYTTALVIDFQDSALDVAQAIGVAYEQLTGYWTHTNPAVGLQSSIDILHPAYHDDFGNDFSGMAHWLAGDVTDLTLYDVPMLGRFSDTIAQYAENFAMATAADVTVEEQAGNVRNAWFSYSRDSDNVVMKHRFDLLAFTTLDGAAYLSGMRPGSTTMQDGAQVFDLASDGPRLDPDVPYEVSWAGFAAELSYAVEVDYWDAGHQNHVHYAGPAYITADPNILTYRVRFETGGCVGVFSLCVNTSAAPMDKLYRVRVTPTDSTTATGLPYSEIFVPGIDFPH